MLDNALWLLIALCGVWHLRFRQEHVTCLCFGQEHATGCHARFVIHISMLNDINRVRYPHVVDSTWNVYLVSVVWRAQLNSLPGDFIGESEIYINSLRSATTFSTILDTHYNWYVDVSRRLLETWSNAALSTSHEDTQVQLIWSYSALTCCLRSIAPTFFNI